MNTVEVLRRIEIIKEITNNMYIKDLVDIIFINQPHEKVRSVISSKKKNSYKSLT